MLGPILWIVVALFPASEIALALVKRSREGATRGGDRGSLLLVWISIALGVFLAVAARSVPFAYLRWPRSVSAVLALGLLLAGLALRWVSILTLGRFFTVDVAIQPDHVVVQKGPYRLVRHPSYTGLLLAFLGVGLSFHNWMSMAVLLLPIGAAIAYRVAREEDALHASLGPAYATYCARTTRFIPWLI